MSLWRIEGVPHPPLPPPSPCSPSLCPEARERMQREGSRKFRKVFPPPVPQGPVVQCVRPPGGNGGAPAVWRDVRAPPLSSGASGSPAFGAPSPPGRVPLRLGLGALGPPMHSQLPAWSLLLDGRNGRRAGWAALTALLSGLRRVNAPWFCVSACVHLTHQMSGNASMKIHCLSLSFRGILKTKLGRLKSHL